MKTIAVSGINAIDNPGPGTGIARALKESSIDVRIIGLAYDAMEPGIYLGDWVDKTYIMPYPSGNKSGFIDRIRHIHQSEKLDVIISTLDAELPVFMDIENELDSIGIKMLIPSKSMFKLREKIHLKDLAQHIGVKCPAYISCSSHGDMITALNRIGFPCMVKGPFYEAFKAEAQTEAETFFHKISHKWGYPVIIQEFINGQEYDLIGCGDGNGGDLGLFAIKKMTTTHLGKVWNAVSISNLKLTGTAQKLLAHLTWRGGFELEVLVEDKTESVYLLEINPRFPAWVYMAAACGINLPERMVQYLLNMDHETHSDYPSGKLMIRYTTEALRDISDFEKITSFGELENNPR